MRLGSEQVERAEREPRELGAAVLGLEVVALPVVLPLARLVTLDHPVLPRDAAAREARAGDPLEAGSEEVVGDRHPQLALQDPGVLRQLEQGVVERRPGGRGDEPVGADDRQVGPRQLAQVAVEPTERGEGVGLVREAVGIGPLDRLPEVGAVPVEVGEVDGEDRLRRVDRQGDHDPGLAAQAVDRLGERRAGEPEVGLGLGRVVGQVVDGEEPDLRSVGRVEPPEVLDGRGEDRRRRDERAFFRHVRGSRGAGGDPAAEDLMILGRGTLGDVPGRHGARPRRDPGEEVRPFGLAGHDERGVVERLVEQIGRAGDVELAPFRTRAVVAAEAILLEHPSSPARQVRPVRPRVEASDEREQAGDDPPSKSWSSLSGPGRDRGPVGLVFPRQFAPLAPGKRTRPANSSPRKSKRPRVIFRGQKDRLERSPIWLPAPGG